MTYINEKLTAAQEFVTTQGADVTTSGTLTDLVNAGTSVIRLTLATTLESLVAADGGKELTLINANSVSLTVKNATGATAANQIIIGTGADLVMPASSQISLKYDSVSAKWRANSAPSALVVLSSSLDFENATLATSVSSNALTISLQTAAAATPSASDFARISMRSATLTSGVYNVRSVTASTTVVIPSGTTIGTVSGADETIFVYAIDNAGTIELAVSLTMFNTAVVQSTTAISSGSSRTMLYSTTARSNVPIRLIGKIAITETTAGTWASNATAIAILPLQDVKKPTRTVFTSGSGTYTTPAGASYLRVQMVGGGGGGGGSSNSTGGGNTTFGTLTANSGNGTSGTTPGIGGIAASIGTGWNGLSIAGGKGTSGTAFNGTNTTVYAIGGTGGNSFFGGSGGGGDSNGAGGAAADNSGSGGGGGGIKNVGSGASSGAGGGAGAYIDVVTTSVPLATYSYAVGAGGTAGGTTSSVYDGGAGAAGIIIIDEFYF